MIEMRETKKLWRVRFAAFSIPRGSAAGIQQPLAARYPLKNSRLSATALVCEICGLNLTNGKRLLGRDYMLNTGQGDSLMME